jgi:hypothetical protein
MQSLKRAIRRGNAVISNDGTGGNTTVRRKDANRQQWRWALRNAVVDAGNVDVLERYNGHAGT